MDANKDVRTGKLTKMLREQGLHNAILSKHPHIGSVTTCERTEKDLPIDAIMTTFDTKDRIQGGYLAFDEGTPGDHRTLCMDIPFELISGNNPPHIQGVDAIPVAVKDPRVREAYNKRAMKAYVKYGILERARHVKQAQNRGDSIAQIKPQIDALIAVTTQIRKEAAVKIRKLKVGKVPWSINK